MMTHTLKGLHYSFAWPPDPKSGIGITVDGHNGVGSLCKVVWQGVPVIFRVFSDRKMADGRYGIILGPEK